MLTSRWVFSMTFGHLQTAGLVRAGRDDAAVQRIHHVGHCGRAATGNFLDFGQGVDLVTRVDAFGAVATEKILVEL